MAENQPRADFRGVKSADDIKGRCIVDDFTDCWHWQGAMRQDRHGKRTPAMYVWDSVKRQYRTVTGPLAVLDVVGRRGPGVKMGWRTCLCDDCVNPAHIAGGTRKDFGRWIRGAEIWRGVPARIVASRGTARSRSRITPEIVERVKASPTGRAAAVALGITESHASKIRLGQIWSTEAAPGASVFTLGAWNA